MTVTLTLSAADGATSTLVLPAPVVNSAGTSADGSTNAPAGSPQFPSLLSNYKARPPWKVASVDYAVGIDRSIYPTNAALKNPASISMAGVSVNATSHVVAISGSNVVLDGYDFSLAGGWWLNISGGSNITVSNCNFLISTNAISNCILRSGNSTNVTITKNIIDGAGKGGQGLISSNGPGTTTITYNLIQNAAAEPVVIATAAGAAPTQDWVFEFNAIGNGGMAHISQGTHGDWIQAYNGSNAVTRSLSCNYNLFFQSATAAAGAYTQGLSLWSAGGNGGTVINQTVNNNTFVYTPAPPNGPYVNYGIILIPKNVQQNITCQNNYYDATGTNVSGFPGTWLDCNSAFGSGGPGGFEGTLNGVPPATAWTAGAFPAGNFNMVAGRLTNSSESSLSA